MTPVSQEGMHLTQDATQVTDAFDMFTQPQPITQRWGLCVSVNSQYSNVSLEDEEVSFGRRSGNTAVVGHAAVSGKHCVLQKEGDVVFLQDYSTNGTTVRHASGTNTRIRKGERVVVSNGDQFDLLHTNECLIGYVLYLSKDLKVDPNNPFAGLYDVRDELGKGAYAIVKLGIKRKTGEKVAVKIIEKRQFRQLSHSNRSDALRDEVKILQAVDHDNIVKIHGYYETDKTIYLVLELMTGGDLFDAIVSIGGGGLPEVKACRFFVQMVKAVQYLHDKNIVHRDIKPENILITDNTDNASIKLTDFGLSRLVDENGFMKTICGTPQYVAPEVIASDTIKYDKLVDLWSLGCMLYILLSGCPPFGDGDDCYDRIKKGDYSVDNEEWQGVQEDGKDLVKGLLNILPRKRMSLDKVLEHPWVKRLYDDAFQHEIEEMKKTNELIDNNNDNNDIKPFSSIAQQQQSCSPVKDHTVDILKTAKKRKLQVTSNNNNNNNFLQPMSPPASKVKRKNIFKS